MCNVGFKRISFSLSRNLADHKMTYLTEVTHVFWCRLVPSAAPTVPVCCLLRLSSLWLIRNIRAACCCLACQCNVGAAGTRERTWALTAACQPVRPNFYFQVTAADSKELAGPDKKVGQWVWGTMRGGPVECETDSHHLKVNAEPCRLPEQRQQKLLNDHNLARGM